MTPPPGIAAPRRVSLQRFEPRPALRADHLIETDSSDFCGLQSGVSWTRPTCQINQFPSGKEVRRADTVRVARPQIAALAAVMIYLGALRTPGNPPSSCEELTDIALKLREKVGLDPQQRYRLVGVGLSNFREAHQSESQPALFE